MTTEEVKTFLKGYQKAKWRHRQLVAELYEMESIITSISIDYSAERVQTSPRDSSKQIDYLADLRTECIEAADIALNEMENVLSVIKQVGGICAEVLHRRYIEGQPLRLISEDIHYSYASVKRIHGKALQIVSAILEDEPQ